MDSSRSSLQNDTLSERFEVNFKLVEQYVAARPCDGLLGQAFDAELNALTKILEVDVDESRIRMLRELYNRMILIRARTKYSGDEPDPRVGFTEALQAALPDLERISGELRQHFQPINRQGQWFGH
jgi:hypothetical protein